MILRRSETAATASLGQSRFSLLVQLPPIFETRIPELFDSDDPVPSSRSHSVAAVYDRRTNERASDLSVRRASPRLILPQLARIQLDDQLLVDHRLNLFPRGDTRYFAFEGIAIDRQPVGNRYDLGQFQIPQRQLSRLRFVFY
jgi:hypothetical protein